MMTSRYDLPLVSLAQLNQEIRAVQPRANWSDVFVFKAAARRRSIN